MQPFQVHAAAPRMRWHGRAAGTAVLALGLVALCWCRPAELGYALASFTAAVPTLPRGDLAVAPAQVAGSGSSNLRFADRVTAEPQLAEAAHHLPAVTSTPEVAPEVSPARANLQFADNKGMNGQPFAVACAVLASVALYALRTARGRLASPRVPLARAPLVTMRADADDVGQELSRQRSEPQMGVAAQRAKNLRVVVEVDENSGKVPKRAPNVILDESVVQACAGAQEVYEQALRRATAASKAVDAAAAALSAVVGTEESVAAAKTAEAAQSVCARMIEKAEAIADGHPDAEQQAVSAGSAARVAAEAMVHAAAGAAKAARECVVEYGLSSGYCAEAENAEMLTFAALEECQAAEGALSAAAAATADALEDQRAGSLLTIRASGRAGTPGMTAADTSNVIVEDSVVQACAEAAQAEETLADWFQYTCDKRLRAALRLGAPREKRGGWDIPVENYVDPNCGRFAHWAAQEKAAGNPKFAHWSGDLGSHLAQLVQRDAARAAAAASSECSADSGECVLQYLEMEQPEQDSTAVVGGTKVSLEALMNKMRTARGVVGGEAKSASDSELNQWALLQTAELTRFDLRDDEIFGPFVRAAVQTRSDAMDSGILKPLAKAGLILPVPQEDIRTAEALRLMAVTYGRDFVEGAVRALKAFEVDKFERADQILAPIARRAFVLTTAATFLSDPMLIARVFGTPQGGFSVATGGDDENPTSNA